MPKTVFKEIYRELKDEIESGVYTYQSLLPSESELTQRFGCSRSAVRRAIMQLVTDGYVQPLQGKGVRLIRNPRRESVRGLGGLETFKEMALRRGFVPHTETILFEEVVANEALAQRTGFAEGSKLTHVIRVRHADDKAVGTDESFYLSSEVDGLTPEVVNRSVYDYLENDRGIRIVTSKRTITVEAANTLDKEHIDLDGFNALAVMRCNAFDDNGIMVEYTETHQKPGFFVLDETSIRQKAE